MYLTRQHPPTRVYSSRIIHNLSFLEFFHFTCYKHAMSRYLLRELFIFTTYFPPGKIPIVTERNCIDAEYNTEYIFLIHIHYKIFRVRINLRFITILNDYLLSRLSTQALEISEHRLKFMINTVISRGSFIYQKRVRTISPNHTDYFSHFSSSISIPSE